MLAHDLLYIHIMDHMIPHGLLFHIMARCITFLNGNPDPRASLALQRPACPGSGARPQGCTCSNLGRDAQRLQCSYFLVVTYFGLGAIIHYPKRNYIRASGEGLSTESS